jgi:prepilin-type N-terminal cleavage/methylation domain-containing protein
MDWVLMRHRLKDTKGFTLMEVAIVIIVSGVLFAALVNLYGVHLAQKSYRITIENIEASQSAIREFFGLHGRYPCPADPTLGPDDPNYGVEVCRALPTDPCPSTNLVCLNVDSRDADSDGVSDPVVIGGLPFTTLVEGTIDSDYMANKAFDGYNLKLAYAVSENMTRASLSAFTPANPNLGAIPVRDRNGRSAVEPAGSAHYVLLSYGYNGIGAYTRRGDLFEPCLTSTSLPIPPGFNPGTTGVAVERENCDNNDALFVKEILSLTDNDDSYDDILFIGINNMTSLWRRSLFSPPSDTYLYNTNMGSVGVGTLDPVADLNVNGNVRAESAIQSDQGYCDLTRGDCLDPNFLGGAGFACPAGQAATGVENNQLVCTPIFTAPISLTPCPAGQFITGFSNLGNRNCQTP